MAPEPEGSVLPYPAEDIIRVLGPMVTEARLAKMKTIADKRIKDVCVVLEDLADPHNGAAVMRSADAFGTSDVHIIEKKHTFMIAHRVSRGTYRWLNLHKHGSTDACVGKLKGQGYTVVAASMNGTLQPEDLPKIPKLAIVFGNEHAGISDEMKRHVDATYAIPMDGFVESLNVSVASAITLYMATRNRDAGSMPEAQAQQLAMFLLRQVNDAERALKDTMDKEKI